MDVEMPAAPQKSRRRNPKPPPPGKGRIRGSKNKISKATLPGIIAAAMPPKQETLHEILDKMLGVTMPSPYKIDGKAVDNRERLARFMAGAPTLRVTPAIVRNFSFFFAH